MLATEWFKDAELGLAYGLIQSAGQAGSFTAFYGVPALTHFTGTHTTAYLLAIVLAFGSLAALFVAHGLEQSILLPEHRGARTNSSGELADVEVEDGKSVLVIGGGGGSSSGGGFNGAGGSGSSISGSSSISIASGLLSQGSSATGAITPDPSSASSASSSSPLSAVEKQQQQQQSLDFMASSGGDTSGGSGSISMFSFPSAKRLGLHHLFTLRTEFYAVLLAIATYSGCYYTFLAFANDYLAVKYGMHAEEAGALIGVISLASCVLSPITGLLLDKRGGRAHAAFAAMLGACTAFCLMGFTAAPVMPCMALAAVSYAVLPSALYPMIAEVVPEEAFTQVGGRGTRG